MHLDLLRGTRSIQFQKQIMCFFIENKVINTLQYIYDPILCFYVRI